MLFLHILLITSLRYVGSVVLHATYGYEVKSDSDFYVRSVKRAIEPLLHTVHANGSFLVEFIPALKHIPGNYYWLVNCKGYAR